MLFFFQDNLETSRSEQNKLKSFLVTLADMSRQNILVLKSELKELKSQIVDHRAEINLQYGFLGSSWENLSVERDNKEREMLQRVTVDHELEISDHKRVHQAKDEEIKSLRRENLHLETTIRNSAEESGILRGELDNISAKHKKQVEDLERQLLDASAERERMVKETAERLYRDHKAEIDSIRSRFRLMTMERSPSESSLEKIERLDLKDESAAKLMKEMFEKQAKMDMEEAVGQEVKKWQKKVEEIDIKHELLLEDVTKRISEEKDKQIDILREREASLNLECIKYKRTIQQLAESEVQTENSELLQKIEVLEIEKRLLEVEMEKLKQFGNMQDLGTSVAVYEGILIID